MIFIKHKNKKERYCPVTGETLTIRIKHGKIEVTSDMPNEIFEKQWEYLK